MFNQAARSVLLMVMFAAALGTVSSCGGSGGGGKGGAQTPPEIQVTESLQAFAVAQVGTPSAWQSYTVSATGLTGDLTISVNVADFEVSLSSGMGFTDSLSIPASSGSIAPTTIYVQYVPQSGTSHNAMITHAASGAPTQQLSISGSVTTGGGTPTISVVESLTAFTTTGVGVPSAPQSYTVSGADLTDDITVSVSNTDFEVSLSSSSGFTDTLTLARSGSAVPSTMVYIRYSPQAGTMNNAMISHSSSGATTEQATVTGSLSQQSVDAWQAISSTNAPSARGSHSAVWTGSEMIIWGGSGTTSNLNDGGAYSPNSDSWRSLSTTNAPAGRQLHTAVWTGTKMIVWGGYQALGTSLPVLGDGAAYDPSLDEWQSVSNSGAPSARTDHSGVWTGSELIIWGGEDYNGTYFADGAAYNPGSDSWRTISTTGAPSSRSGHSAVWTGTEMIVWGGYYDDGINSTRFNDGAAYNPASDTWRTISSTFAPSARTSHPAVWTGAELIVWGGSGMTSNLNDGGVYTTSTDMWRSTSSTNAPIGRNYHSFVWTGAAALVWGGEIGSITYAGDGASYNPTQNVWQTISTNNAPSARNTHTAVWTGSEMIVWGGYDGADLGDGAAYTP